MLIEPPASISGGFEKGRKEKMKNIETRGRRKKREKERERENEVSINSQEVRHRCQFHGAIGGHETARWGKRKVPLGRVSRVLRDIGNGPSQSCLGEGSDRRQLGRMEAR